MNKDIKKIEYYLGKDHFKDKYFKKEFPPAYKDIHSRELSVEEYISKTLYLNHWYPNIEFKLNNLGYRSHFDYQLTDLIGKKIIACFGCTDTFGMNHQYEHTWPYLLSLEADNFTVLNLGIIGASADTISRILIKLTGVLEIEHACILWPHNNRREFVSKEYTGIITTHNQVDTPYEDYWDFIDWKSDNYNFFKNYHLCKNLCENKKIHFNELLINRFDKKVPFDYSGNYYALGPNSHCAIANYFFKKINDDKN
jgi:hypothetical protein